MKREFRLHHFIILGLLLGFILNACNKSKHPEAEIRPVKTLLVGSLQDSMTRIFPGRVLASNQARLAFEVPGRLIQFPVLEGDSVKAGQLLAEIDPRNYQEKFNEAQAVLIRTKAEYERFAALVTKGYVSQTDYDQKRAAYLVAQANFNTAEKDLKDTKILAPFPGVISRKFVKNFENVKAKQDILLLQDLSQLDIEIQVPESLILNLREGKKPIRSMKAIFEAAPNKFFPVTLKEFSSQADPQTQTYRVVTTFSAPQTIRVFPGMSVSVVVEMSGVGDKTTHYILLPAEAVFDGPDAKPSVWVVDPKTLELKRRVVEISRLEKGEVHILSGLQPGERVVVAGVNFLRENQKVSIMPPLPGE